MQKKIVILEVPFDQVTLETAVKKVEEMIESEGQFQIATPNPEMVLEARKNEKFLHLLQKTELNIPDGIGIVWASKWLKFRGKDDSLPQRVTGTDLMEKILKKSTESSSHLFQKKVFLLGAAEGVAKKTKEIFEKKFPDIQITGFESGTPDEKDEEDLIQKINHSQAKILFVAYGAPKQEFWIARNLHKMPLIKIAIGVGGAFDFFAGIRKRAPDWMQKTGLEWLYRAIQEPRRIKRIYNAVIKFPLAFLFSSKKKR
ncbi:MAG: WecB/TagA/CpsF family glycosyltransferase [Patescibacteria group bacterium]